ncbi:hypothetical protein [Vibrio sp. Hal054]|uniref:hypothetical protein n=1 Tax=Vibrio sp. Hal054 TaxID=3035158 RepID=UPI00301DB3F9
MSNIHSVSGNLFEYVVTDMFWRNRAKIENNTQYVNTFESVFSKYTPMGVIEEQQGKAGLTLSVGVLKALPQDSAISLQQCVSLAIALKKGFAGQDTSTAKPSDVEIVNLFLCELSDELFYACAFQGARVVVDIAIPYTNRQSVVDCIDDLGLLELADSSLVKIVTIGRGEQTPRLSQVCEPFNARIKQQDAAEAANAVVGQEKPAPCTKYEINHLEEDWLTKLNSLSKKQLPYISSIKTYKRSKFTFTNVVTVGGFLVLCAFAGNQWFSSTSDTTKPKTSSVWDKARSKAGPIEEVAKTAIIDKLPFQDSEAEYKSHQEKLMQTYESDKQLYETHVRASGTEPMYGVISTIGMAEVNIEGYKLTQALYINALGQSNSLTKKMHYEYVRESKTALVNDFMSHKPSGIATSDGNKIVLTEQFTISEYEAPFKIDDVTGISKSGKDKLISILQGLKADNSILSWTLAAIDPKAQEGADDVKGQTGAGAFE